MSNRTFLIVVAVLLAIIALSSLAIWNSYVELTRPACDNVIDGRCVEFVHPTADEYGVFNPVTGGYISTEDK